MLPTCVQTPKDSYNWLFQVRRLAKAIVSLRNQNCTIGRSGVRAPASAIFAPTVFDQFNVNSNDCGIAFSLGKSAYLPVLNHEKSTG
jgi:hypothetical protein